MQKIVGWVLFLFSFFFLGMYLYTEFFVEKPLVSPIPDIDNVKVIMLSPAKNK